MKKYPLILLILFMSIGRAEQPLKGQAIEECNQLKYFSKQIAEMKNSGVTKQDIQTLRNMASDGDGIMGEFSVIFLIGIKKGLIQINFQKKCIFNV